MGVLVVMGVKLVVMLVIMVLVVSEVLVLILVKLYVFDIFELEMCEKMMLIWKVIFKVMVNSKYIVLYVILFDEVEVSVLMVYWKKYK